MAVREIEWSGAPAREETGAGLIDELKRKEGGRNAQLVITATHARLQDPVTGWLDTEAADLMAIAEAAAGGKRVVEYRIVTHRKAGIDPTIAIKDLGNRDKVRDVIDLRFAGDGADQHKRDERPSNGSQNGASSASTGGPAPAPSAPPAAPPRGQSAPPSPPPPDAPARDRQSPPAAEGKAWELRNTDGRLNLGSYAVLAAAGMVGLAVELLAARGPDVATNPAAVKALAGYLLAAADAVQAGASHDRRVDRMSNLHTRARGAVRDAVVVFPPPAGATREAVEAWRDELTGYASTLLATVIELTEAALAD